MTEPPQRPRIRVGTQTGLRHAIQPSHQVSYQHPLVQADTMRESKRPTGQKGPVAFILLALLAIGLVVWLARGVNNPSVAVPPSTIEPTLGGDENVSAPMSDYGGETPDNTSSDIAGIARSRFLAELTPSEFSGDTSLLIEPGTPPVAVASLNESLDHTLQFLGRYFDSSSKVVVVGLMTQEWAADALEAELDTSTKLVSDVTDYLVEEDYGIARDSCAGSSGFAQTDFEQSVVVVDVGASCNWSPGGWFDDSETVLPHELMHVAQFGLGGACASIPVWFGEGQAHFAGWNLAIAGSETLYTESRAFTIETFSATRHSSLRELETYTDGGAEYLVGALAIELLVAEHGWASTIDLLSSLNRKTAGCVSEYSEFDKFETAFETIYGESLDSFSQRVWAYAGLS